MEPILRCPDGHAGPWRYVAAVEMWRDAVEVANDTERALVVQSLSQTGEGYDDELPGTRYLECQHRLDDGSRCVERIEIPDDLRIAWD